MKVLVTGATGFLGRWVCRTLALEGWKVIATDLPNSNFSEIAEFCYKIVPADLTREVPNGEKPDAICHVAGLFDLSAPFRKLWEVNVGATAKLVKEFSGKVGAFLYVSTTGVYGLPKKLPASEDTPPNPRNGYEITKFVGERVALNSFRGKVCAVRPTLIYGPGSLYGHAMLIGLFALASCVGKKELPSIKGGPMTHSVHVEDVARAICFLLKKLFDDSSVSGEVFNVADDTPVNFEKFLSTIASACGVKLKPILNYPTARLLTLLVSSTPYYPKLKRKALDEWERVLKEKGLSSPLKPRLDEGWNDYFVGSFYYDTSKIKALGFEPKWNFEEGMRETVRWYKERGWIPSCDN